jgi:hypothetical protein
MKIKFISRVIFIGNVKITLWLPEGWILEVEERETLLAYHEFEDVGNFRITLINYDDNENGLLYEFPLDHVQDEIIDFDEFTAYFKEGPDPEPDSEGDLRIMGYWQFRVPGFLELAIVSSNIKKYLYEEEGYDAFYLQHAILEHIGFEKKHNVE